MPTLKMLHQIWKYYRGGVVLSRLGPEMLLPLVAGNLVLVPSFPNGCRAQQGAWRKPVWACCQQLAASSSHHAPHSPPTPSEHPGSSVDKSPYGSHELTHATPVVSRSILSRKLLSSATQVPPSPPRSSEAAATRKANTHGNVQACSIHLPQRA